MRCKQKPSSSFNAAVCLHGSVSTIPILLASWMPNECDRMTLNIRIMALANPPKVIPPPPVSARLNWGAKCILYYGKYGGRPWRLKSHYFPKRTSCHFLLRASGNNSASHWCDGDALARPYSVILLCVCCVCLCVHCALDLALIWHRDIRYGAAPTLTHRNTRKCARFGLWMGGCGQGQSSLVYWICHYYYIQHVLHGHSPIFPQKVCVTEWGAPKRFGGVVWWWDKHTFRVRMHPSETLVWLGGVAKKAIDTNVQRPAPSVVNGDNNTIVLKPHKPQNIMHNAHTDIAYSV